MANLIKKVKIKKQDGTFTDYIPLAVNASEVDMSNGKSLEYTIGSVDPDVNGDVATQLSKSIRYYDCVSDMKADTTLSGGSAAKTLGYYEPRRWWWRYLQHHRR